MNEVQKFGILDVVTASIVCVEQYGFIAKKDADVNTPATASRVQKFLLRYSTDEISEMLQHRFEDAAELVEWAKETGRLRGDFGHTIRQMLEKGAITLAQVAFLVTLPNQRNIAEKRSVEAEVQSEESAGSEWFGVVRKRSDFFVKLTEKKFVNRFNSYIYKVVTEEGNIGSFFSQKKFDISVDDCFVMKATPKRHIVSEWHGGKETQFNRVVITEVIGQKETAQ
jgi:hypothetical protein